MNGQNMGLVGIIQICLMMIRLLRKRRNVIRLTTFKHYLDFGKHMILKELSGDVELFQINGNIIKLNTLKLVFNMNME